MRHYDFIYNIKPFLEADENSLVWIKDNRYTPEQTNAKVIVVPSDYIYDSPNKELIKSENPRLTFILMAKKYVEPKLANVKIGKNFTKKEYVVIGTDGFGFEKDENGVMQHFPHYGDVVIGDNVWVGAFVCIDRGTIGDTKIGNGVKIDNFSHIAHNVEIGDNAIIGTHSILCGSVKIGKNTWIAPNVVIREGLIIGDNVLIGMGSVVTKNIPNNETWYGNPAKKKYEQHTI